MADLSSLKSLSSAPDGTVVADTDFQIRCGWGSLANPFDESKFAVVGHGPVSQKANGERRLPGSLLFASSVTRTEEMMLPACSNHSSTSLRAKTLFSWQEITAHDHQRIGN